MSDKKEAPESKEVPLQRPYEVGGQTISKVTFRRPKVRDRLAAEQPGNTDAQTEIALIGLCVGMSADELAEMDLEDYMALNKQLRDFTGLDR